ncbi:hypothetical protein RRG08_013067 [Elysia crispata]|uniref:Uncharacterized protein n=1 Tax=Elysia crispata TaxID=231223 RepID=A0AAE1DQ56_9GAST|nr:hypothetical protein RRG08_013067 [Elysia crispata]
MMADDFPEEHLLHWTSPQARENQTGKVRVNFLIAQAWYQPYSPSVIKNVMSTAGNNATLAWSHHLIWLRQRPRGQ